MYITRTRPRLWYLLIISFTIKASSIGICNPRTGSSILTNENDRYVTNITQCFFPSNESEIISIINQAKLTNASVKGIGNGLSFSSNGMMDNTSTNYYYSECTEYNYTNSSCMFKQQSTYLVNLTVNMNKILEINSNKMYAIIEAGVKNVDLLETLDKYKLAVYSYGSPIAMPFISSSSTGTHPWGTMLNNVSTMASNILEFRLVIANGSVLICNGTLNSDIFNAGRIAFGTFGIISSAKIRLKASFNVTGYLPYQKFNVTTFKDVYDTFYNEIYPNIFLNKSYTDGGYFAIEERFLFQQYDITNSSLNMNPIEKNVPIYEQKCRYNASINWQNRPCTDTYWRPMYTQEPFGNEFTHTKQQEMEMFIDAMYFEQAYMDVIRFVIKEKEMNTNMWQNSYNYYLKTGFDFAIEGRYVGSDNIWLSQGYKQPRGEIGIYYTANKTHRPDDSIVNPWFTSVYNLLKNKYGKIKVHFGKESLTKYCDLIDSYDKLDDFIQLRNQLDPNQMFVNQFARDKLKLCSDYVEKGCCCTQYSCFVNETQTQSFAHFV